MTVETATSQISAKCPDPREYVLNHDKNLQKYYITTLCKNKMSHDCYDAQLTAQDVKNLSKPQKVILIGNP